MSINIATLTRHPERLGKDTLYELRSLLARYPYYQPARLLLLKNLYLLHDPTFDEELRRAAVYITERQRLFDLTEGPHYQLRDDQSAEHEAAKHETAKHESSEQGAPEGDRTAALIRRGYPLPCFEKAVRELRDRGISVVVHTILGLPGETEEDILATIRYLNHQDIQGIKLQFLHVLKGTDLAAWYEDPGFPVFTEEQYLDLVIRCIEELSPKITIHRLTGDGPKELLIAPLWSSRKRSVLNEIHRQLKLRNSWQGKSFLS